MKKRILSYLNRIDTLLSENSANTDWQSVTEEHPVQVSFFQHERLVHLIVTVVFGLLTVMSVGIVLMTGYLSLLVLTVLFCVLLIPYIFHYYLLENGVQRMYAQYDELLKRCRSADNKN